MAGWYRSTCSHKRYGAGARVPPCASSSLIFTALFLVLFLTSASYFSSHAYAQNQQPGIAGLGDLVVTGFSGTLPPPAGPPLPPGVNELDETFINPDGASLKVFDVRNPGGPPEAKLIGAPVKFQAFARDIGQVFGLALDKSNPPNIYASGTSVHGLHIVVPDADGDGRPERIKLGQPGAQWMNGQFGIAKGGGPGTVWKIDGETSEITKFADIQTGGIPNSGAGLGNIAYDARHKQLFVSDLDTGFIHRLDMTGRDLGKFDHGLQGRPANGMNAVPDNPAERLDITSPAFDAEDSSSWGMTSPERRTWGLAVHGGRLYYAVEAGPQIWSVGIKEDGSFGDDPRWELDVPSDPNAYPVSDIAFTGKGLMLLAQRGGIASRYDYSQYHMPRKTRVLSYRLEKPDDPATPSRWVSAPEDYAIGFPGIHRNTSGGIALGYGYNKKPDGTYGFGSCEGTLWTTGDALRDNPVHGARLAQGGPLNVHGLQGNALGLVRPGNAPPWESYYVDFDGQFDDPQASGHVGDVEIARECGQRASIMDLRILKQARPERCAPDTDCAFGIDIINSGNRTYTGPLLIHDIVHSGATLASSAPAAWDCKLLFPLSTAYECRHPGVTLAPGEKISLELVFHTPGWWNRPVYDNCVDLRIPGAGIDQRPYNNRSCDYVAFCSPGEPGCVPDLQLQKFGRYGACDFFGLCEFSVIVSNVGPVPYTGQLNVDDFATTPGATMVDWSSKAEWNCAATGPDKYGCTTLAPVTLSPGEFRELIILVQGPAIAPGVTHVRNCAFIDWDGAPPDPNPHNEFDCAEISNLPPGHPDARATVIIEKDGLTHCGRVAAGNPWSCLFVVRVKNSGTAPLMGPIALTDELSAHPATLLGFGGGPGAWGCAPGVGFAGPYTCTHPAIAGGLLPGEHVSLTLFFQLPAGIVPPSSQENCATIQWDNDGDGAAEDHKACAISLICDAGSANCPQDLAVSKWAQAGPCLKATDCHFFSDINNIANVAFPGPLNVTDIPDPGTGAPNIVSPGWVCNPVGGSYSCTHPAGLPANGAATLDLSFQIPAGFVGNTFKNCVKVDPGPGNDFPGNDENCGTAFVPQPLPADLGPWSDTTCKKGASCPLPARIDNLGEQTFTGSAGVRGVLSPDLPIASITSKTPGFSCSKTGSAAYECKGSRLSIAPGKAVEYTVTVNVPAGYPHSQVSHIKNMVWPDAKVRDKNPKNDQHVSIITIEQDQEPPPPPPPPPPVGQPDLAVSKSANQGACPAGAPGCGFTVTLRNQGTAPFQGEIRLRDVITPNARLSSPPPAPWRCVARGGPYFCTYPATTLLPGQSLLLPLRFTLPPNATGAVNNCVSINWGRSTPGGKGVRDVQSELASRGFNPGPADGRAGRQTVEAVRSFQSQQGLPPTGRIDQSLISALFGPQGGGSGDANPANDRACVYTAIIGQPPPPPPPSCTGGRYRNNYGACVCPTHIPVWTGSKCIPRPPAQCTGGRYRDNKGICVCPADKPIWTGRQCIQPGCTGGRIRNTYGQCVCPPSLPNWNGQSCSGIIGPQPCSGGRYRDNKGQCVCPSNKPTWTGIICIPKITICSGGRQLINGKCVCTGRREFRNGQCRCPVSLPYWNGKTCGGIIGPQCTGGRIKDRKGNCVCPSSRPNWNGQQCIKYTTNPGRPPGGGEITPGPSQPNCSGGRYYDQKSKSCKCPASKPLWLGGKCSNFKLPGGIKIPGLKVQ